MHTLLVLVCAFTAKELIRPHVAQVIVGTLRTCTRATTRVLCHSDAFNLVGWTFYTHNLDQFVWCCRDARPRAPVRWRHADLFSARPYRVLHWRGPAAREYNCPEPRVHFWPSCWVLETFLFLPNKLSTPISFYCCNPERHFHGAREGSEEGGGEVAGRVAHTYDFGRDGARRRLLTWRDRRVGRQGGHLSWNARDHQHYRRLCRGKPPAPGCARADHRAARSAHLPAARTARYSYCPVLYCTVVLSDLVHNHILVVHIVQVLVCTVHTT